MQHAAAYHKSLHVTYTNSQGNISDCSAKQDLRKLMGLDILKSRASLHSDDKGSNGHGRVLHSCGSEVK